jgi:hypothetical protein
MSSQLSVPGMKVCEGPGFAPLLLHERQEFFLQHPPDRPR